MIWNTDQIHSIEDPRNVFAPIYNVSHTKFLKNTLYMYFTHLAIQHLIYPWHTKCSTTYCMMETKEDNNNNYCYPILSDFDQIGLYQSNKLTKNTANKEEAIGVPNDRQQ